MVPSRPELIEATATGDRAYPMLAPTINHEFVEIFRSSEYIESMKSIGAAQKRNVIKNAAFPIKSVERSAKISIHVGVAVELPIPT